MTTIYRTDSAGYFIGETFTVTDPFAALPQGVTTEPPALTGSQVAQWIGTQWIVMDERPVPPISVPQSVTMRQARLALLGAGLLGQIDATIASLPSPQKEAAQIEWEYSQEVQRRNGFVDQLAPLLGLTDEQVDQLFIQAATL